MKTIKMNKNNVINILLYIIFLISYLFVLTMYGMGDSRANIRYYILFIATVLTMLSLIIRTKFFLKNKKVYGKALLFLIPLSIIILVFSFLKAKNLGRTMAFRTIVQTGLVLMPGIYAFGFVNLYSTKTIVNFMKFTLIALIIGYFFEGQHSIFNFFSIEKWSSITSKVSFTESNICASEFVQLFLFFNYFKRMKVDDYTKNRCNIYYYIAIIFSILSYKRLGIVFVFAIIIMNKFINWNKELPKIMPFVLATFFSITTVYYFRFVEGTLFPNFDVYQFTTGRNYILSLWRKSDYFSYGFGTSMLVIKRYLEMDLVQIYLEMNFTILFIFCLTYFTISKANIYSATIMTYSFLNLLTASSLPSLLAWILLFINVTIFSSSKCYDDEIEFKDKGRIKIVYNKL